MTIHFKKVPPITNPIIIKGSSLERVQHFKLLGVWISDDLTWDFHITKQCNRASTRFYFLKQLKRSGLPPEGLLTFYKTIIRPILEYACQVWHPGLTKENAESLERIQKRVFNLIYPDVPYSTVLETHQIESLEARRHQLCRKFFHNMSQDGSRLKNILPEESTYNHNVRHPLKYPLPSIQNKRFRKDFVIYSLFQYQK